MVLLIATFFAREDKYSLLQHFSYSVAVTSALTGPETIEQIF